MKKIILPALITLFALTGCTEEGIGGESSISGQVKHHSTEIPGAVVFIKYGAEELPGTTPSAFDAQTTASSVDGQFQFDGLEKGDYYLYSVGYDSSIVDSVFGGLNVTLKKGKSKQIDIPVTE